MTTFETYLEGLKGTLDDGLIQLLANVAKATRQISDTLRTSSLTGLSGATETINVQGETQKPLDILSNDLMLDACKASAAVSFAVSEELDSEVPVHADGAYAVIFDPLDGSSNLDVNVTVGTIFSVIPAASASDLLQSGRAQVVAGYAAYGPQTCLVITVGKGVQIFTLDDSGSYILTASDVKIVPETKEFAINAARRASWDDVVASYIERSIDAGYNMRWVGSMVADAHRIFNRGGVFLYPADRNKPTSGGRLRLLYEANPMGLLVEAAGGAAVVGDVAILDLKPTALHQRVPVIFGSRVEVKKIADAYKASKVAEPA